MIDNEFFNKITQCLNQEDYEQAIKSLETWISQGHTEPEAYYYLGLSYLLSEDIESCLGTWLSLILTPTVEEERAQIGQALVDFLEKQVQHHLKIGKLGQAKIIYQVIFELNDQYENIGILTALVTALYQLATQYGRNQQYEEAIIVYSDILSLNPNYSLAWHSLALCHFQQENYLDAEDAMEQALALDPSAANSYGLGRILEKKEDYIGAVTAYNRAIELNPNFLDVYITLGNLHYERQNIEQALNCYEQLLKKSEKAGQPQIKQQVEKIYQTLQHPQAARYLASLYYGKDNYDQAINYYEAYLVQEPGNIEIEIYLNLGQCYVRTNQTHRAIGFIEQNLESHSDNLSLQTFNQSILPIVYKKSQDIKFYRHRYKSLLEELLKNYLPHDLDKANQAFVGTQKNNLFYLAYQGENDVVIQQQYAVYLNSILKIAYPQFCQPKKISDDISCRKIRIGFVSQHLEGLGQLYIGWLKYLDHEEFDFYTYDLSREPLGKLDTIRNQFNTYSQQMWFLGKDDNLIDLCEKIDSDQLDILVMPEIAVSARVGPLACLRLAPIQCTTWAHPVTSGSPNMDYFLSSELMEPPNGDEHYSEILVRLPNLAFAIEKKEVITHTKKRSDFGLREDATIFWCCQSLFKYLPQHDFIFAAIAQHCPAFQFVFIESDHSPIVTKTFKTRLQVVFKELNLNYQDYCFFLPRLNRSDFNIVTQLSDIFLDCLSWSGGFTTKEAVTVGLPIVTHPGELMRARHSYGILKMIGVTETIAETIDDYIAIAVRLGLNYEWRQTVRQKILDNGDRMFEDQSCISAVEAFFKEVAQKY